MAGLDRKALQRYRQDPAAFITESLIDPEKNKPFVLLDAERQFLQHCFKMKPNGRLLYPDLMYCAVKKSGKTTFASILIVTILVLYGERYAEAYVYANDKEQASQRVFEICRRIVEAAPLLRREAKVSQDRITITATGATIVAMASDYASAAGAAPTVSCFDEIWGATSERARRVWDEAVPTPTRKFSCRLIVSHAGFEDKSELLYELYQRGLKQSLVGPDLHAGDGMLMFWSHQPIAHWQDEEWLTDMRRSLRPNQYVRMIENRFTTTETSFIDMTAWDACVDHELTPVLKDKSLPVFVGIDAAHKHDSTGIVAVTPQGQKLRLVFNRVFQPHPHDPLDFEGTIEATLYELKHRFRLVKVLFDPMQMISTAQRLTRAGIKIEEYPQSIPNLTAASQGLYELIQGRNLLLYPDKAMRLAASHAVAKETGRGWFIVKERQSHRIDVIVALGMACRAALDSQTKPQHPTGEMFRRGLEASERRSARQRMGLGTPEAIYGERRWAQLQRRWGANRY